jgi:hypothetical protein
VADFISNLIKVNNLSLREIETLYRHMCIFQTVTFNDAFSERSYIGYSSIKFLAVFIFCFKPKLVLDVEHEKLKVDDIAQLIGLTEIPRINVRHPNIEELILAMVSRDSLTISHDYEEHPDDLIAWNKNINQGCMSGSVDDNECSDILKDAFNTLALAG